MCLWEEINLKSALKQNTNDLYWRNTVEQHSLLEFTNVTTSTKTAVTDVNRAAYVLSDTPFGSKMSDWFSETAMFTGTS